MTIWVDADHARDQATWRSVTAIMVFINGTLVKTVSKKQRTVEMSTYGSELVAARVATEIAIEYRHTLRQLGVAIDGPTLMLGDNQSVVLNTTIPSSVLKKKHASISYHRIREAIAGNIIKFHHVPSGINKSDLLSKPLDSISFHGLLEPVLFSNNPKATMQDSIM